MVKKSKIGQSAAKLGNELIHPRRFRDYMVAGDENCKIFRAQDIVQSD
jgi:hypothetical protein